MTPTEVLELARKHAIRLYRFSGIPIDAQMEPNQLSALIAEVEARTLERAAVECEHASTRAGDTYDCADAIRSLKPGQGADSQGGRG